MKKHTYLIMAHNEFEVLKELLLGLDDDRNHIYIHFDKKVKEIPDLKLEKSKLYILENRIDVRWGTFLRLKPSMHYLKKHVK